MAKPGTWYEGTIRNAHNFPIHCVVVWAATTSAGGVRNAWDAAQRMWPKASWVIYCSLCTGIGKKVNLGDVCVARNAVDLGSGVARVGGHLEHALDMVQCPSGVVTKLIGMQSRDGEWRQGILHQRPYSVDHIQTQLLYLASADAKHTDTVEAFLKDCKQRNCEASMREIYRDLVTNKKWMIRGEGAQVILTAVGETEYTGRKHACLGEWPPVADNEISQLHVGNIGSRPVLSANLDPFDQGLKDQSSCNIIACEPAIHNVYSAFVRLLLFQVAIHSTFYYSSYSGHSPTFDTLHVQGSPAVEV